MQSQKSRQFREFSAENVGTLLSCLIIFPMWFMKRTVRHLACRLALFGMLFNGLSPVLASAVAGTDSQFSVICSTSGTRTSPDKDAGGNSSHNGLQPPHCSLCTPLASLAPSPTVSTVPVFDAGWAGPYSAASDLTLPADSGFRIAHPRAPPPIARLT